ncbi:hypothetical protein BpHYR1_052472 [Brachionus plicatilis]|uniref:Uncharacterized protein n=1 Tax=Brachionus plicatilis TaxID=10195 RepID=A0A3M7QP08_BRAPC|nr:hypothetical protein BpHYR1_052472 [Brachionus plicatilis]
MVYLCQTQAISALIIRKNNHLGKRSGGDCHESILFEFYENKNKKIIPKILRLLNHAIQYSIMARYMNRHNF